MRSGAAFPAAKTLALLAACSLSPGAAPAQAPAKDRVLCSLNGARATACVLTDVVAADGTHRMSFAFGRARVSFVGRSQTGWWAGRLNGRPAMGYELNRGRMSLSTQDLGLRFDWWYPGSEHGSY